VSPTKLAIKVDRRDIEDPVRKRRVADSNGGVKTTDPRGEEVSSGDQAHSNENLLAGMRQKGSFEGRRCRVKVLSTKPRQLGKTWTPL